MVRELARGVSVVASSRDDMSSLAYSTRLYRHLGETMAAWARRYCAGRVVSILEGGYHLDIPYCVYHFMRGVN